MPRNQKIVFRQGTTTPGAPNFEVGEPAWDKLNKRLYIKAEDGTMVEIAGGGGGGTGNSFTASETPPEAPLDGDLWLDKTSGILYLYSPDGDSSQWVEHSAPVAAPVFLASTIPPTSPNAGDEWLDETSGLVYRYVDDAWVEIGPGGVATGATPYDVAVANGFQGSEAQWLASLVGPAGADGAPGIPGENSPGFTASTTEPASPELGDEWLNLTSGIHYRYLTTESGSQWVEISGGAVAGPQGPEGPQGPTGPPGEDNPGFTASTTEPASPELGDEWLNLTTGVQYRYITTASGSQWVETSAGGGASSSPIVETQQVISQDIELSAGFNGLSVGPVEVADTYAVTVPENATWAIV